jgi:ATP-dependent Clp protease protease subunit
MTKPRTLKAALKPFFRASVATDGEFEILLYDEIGADWMGNGITAKSVRASLDEAGAYSKISLRINSPGGDAFEGIAIGNVLKATGKPIDVYVDGLAASAASIVAMCGDTITMASNAMMMVHNAWTLCAGYASDMRKMADTLDRISTSIAQTYVDKTGKPMDEIQALMDAESWMSAADCVEGGFATAIAAANEPAIAMARGFKVLNLMKRVPESLQNNDLDSVDGCQCYCQACLDDDCANCSNVECDDSNCSDCPMQEQRAGNSVTPATKDSIVDASVSDLKRARLALAERMQRRSSNLYR